MMAAELDSLLPISLLGQKITVLIGKMYSEAGLYNIMEELLYFPQKIVNTEPL